MRSIARVLDTVIGSFEELSAVSGSGINVGRIIDSRAELSKMTGQLQEIERNINRSSEAQKDLNRAVKDGTSSADGLLGRVKSLAATYAGIQSLKKAIDLSDSISSTGARLKTLSDNVEETEKKIMASANRSRAVYLNTADAVAKLSSNAGSAFNNDLNQVIAFSELVNKQFILSGTSAQEQSAAMLQLTQAMANSVRSGDALNRIFMQAPGFIQNVTGCIDRFIGKAGELTAAGLSIRRTVPAVTGSAAGWIAAIHAVGAAFSETGGGIGGIFGALWMGISGAFILPLRNGIGALADFIGSAFTAPAAAVKGTFYDLYRTINGYIRSLAQDIESLCGRISGASVDLTSGLGDLYSGTAAASQLEYIAVNNGWKGYQGSTAESRVGRLETGSTRTGNAAAYTADAAGRVFLSEESRRGIRDSAEGRTLSDSRAVEITVNQTNHNSINSELDIDRVSEGLAEYIIRDISISADGVHV